MEHVRTADDDQGRVALTRTAAALRALTHPGVVEVVDAAPDGSRLVTRWAGVPLAALGQLDDAHVAGLGAAAAAVLGDVHALGWAHGALTAEHLLIGDDGRPVVCGWGAAVRGGVPQRDVIALGRLLAEARAGASSRRLGRVLADAVDGRLDAVALARRLGDARLDPRLPVPADLEAAGAHDGDRHRASPVESRRGSEATAATLGRRRGVPADRRKALVIALAATAAVLVTFAVGARRAQGPASCPASDRGCRALPAPDGVVVSQAGLREQVAAPGQIVVLGRWHCAASLPAVLDPGTGQVWAYDAWATPSLTVTARPVATVAAAAALTVAPGRRCDTLVVSRRRGGDVTVLRGTAR